MIFATLFVFIAASFAIYTIVTVFTTVIAILTILTAMLATILLIFKAICAIGNNLTRFSKSFVCKNKTQ
jgi:hypothetical protein